MTGGAVYPVGENPADVPPTIADAANSRLHGIDILRALAALVVVLYHARTEFWIGLQQTYRIYGSHTVRPDIWLSYASIPFSLGWLGVPVFFVLSGYCIHLGVARKLTNDPGHRLDVRKFYIRRIVRIYPVYIAALLLQLW